VADIIRVLETIAPPGLAEDWDNAGLQIGDPGAAVRAVWVALDPSPPVVAAACRAGVDLLVTHHPLIYRPLKRIDLRDPTGGIVAEAVSHRLAIFSMHTNLDAVHGGLNDWLARRLGLRATKPLVAAAGSNRRPEHGIGRIGTLAKTCDLKNLALEVKERLGVSSVRIAGDPALRVRRVAVSTGSGGSLLAGFLAADAEVFISGDMRYHDARAIESAQRGLVDIGHFHSEHLMAGMLAQRLRRALGRRGAEMRVEACTLEKDPFQQL
jgi:dinuclear metal center YbgI/SA1388 family protein